MSLLITKDNIHITNGENTASSMRGGILANSTFHMDMDFIEYEYYNATSYNHTGGNTVCGFSSSLVNTLVSTGYLYFIISGNVSYTFCSAISNNNNSTLGSWQASNSIPASIVNAPTVGYNFKTLSGTHTNVLVCVIKVSSTGFYYKTPRNNSSSTVIGNGNINVKGINLASFKYIRTTDLNSNDRKFTINGNRYGQLINSNSNGNGEIIANSSTIEVKSSGGTIFSASDINAPKEFYFFFSSFLTPSSSSIDNTATVFNQFYNNEAGALYQFPVGSLMFIQVHAGETESTPIICSGVFEYVDGLIVDIGSFWYPEDVRPTYFDLVNTKLYGVAAGSTIKVVTTRLSGDARWSVPERFIKSIIMK